MKKNNLIAKISTLAAAVVMMVGANNAFAEGVTADAIIFNEVTVNYTAANGEGAYNASDTVSVTVTFVSAEALIKDDGGDVASVLDGIYTHQYIIHPTANGLDEYTFSADVGAEQNLANSSVEIKQYLYGSDTPSATGTEVKFNLKSAIAISNMVSGVIEFPPGTLASGNQTFATGNYVYVDNAVYEITAIDNGTLPSQGDPSGSPATLTLVVPGTTTAAPNPSADITGTAIGEVAFVEIVVKGNPTDGSSASTIEITPTVTNGTDETDFTTTTVSFAPIIMGITKTIGLVKGTYAETVADGVKPGEPLFYQIEVEVDATSAAAGLVYVSDALPLYTTLDESSIKVSFDANDDNFDVSDLTITVANDNVEDSTNKRVSGFVDKTNPAEPKLVIYLGNEVTAASGGNMLPSETAVITYTVTVD